MRRLAGTLSVSVVAALVLCSSAGAAFHLMKVREVRPSTNAGSNDGFIELQMYSSGQNFTGGHQVTVYGTAGEVIRTATLTNVANGDNNRTVLLAESATVGAVTADTVDSLLNIPVVAGAVCFAEASPPDCVTWGAFLPPVGFVDPQLAPANPPSAGMSLTRSIVPGCGTLLDEPYDDTDDSSTDFAPTTPSPRANGDPVTETDCVLTVNIGGAGVGSVDSDLLGIDCPSDCSHSYSGQDVTLTPTANAATGSTFANWQPGCSFVTMNQCSVQMNQSKSVTAVFDAPTSPLLTVTRAGAGSGTVVGTGIDCGTDCDEVHPSGMPVTLTANPATGSSFASWTGCPAGPPANPCTYNADLNRTITANFALPAALIPPPALTSPAKKKCKKGRKLKKGKCVKKKRKKK